MKTIIVPVTSNFFSRNFLRTDSFSLLKSHSEVRIVLLAPRGKMMYYQREFAAPNVVIETLPFAIRDFISERFFRFVEQSSIVTVRSSMDQVGALLRAGSGANFLTLIPALLFFIVQRFIRLCGYLGRPWRSTIRFLYLCYPRTYFSEIFRRYSPDAVFCPTMIFSEDYCLMREAKRRGVHTVGMIFSWDTFYSKTFLRLHPDRLLVQTDALKSQAVRMGDYPEEKIRVIGVPHYDRHFQRKGIISREEFVRGLGGDPSKKLILYAFSGKAGLHLDMNIVTILHDILTQSGLKDIVEVLLRPYPRLDFPEEKVARLRSQYGFLGRSSTSSIGTSRDEWEMDEEAISLLINSIAHADIVITMYSTFFIEAAIFDKPLIGVAFDGDHPFPYWNSARRFFDWDHLRDVKPLGGVWLVRSKDEFLEAIQMYLRNPEYLRQGREKIVQQQCQFTDGRSAKRLSNILTDEQ